MREAYRLLLKSQNTAQAQTYMSLIFVGYEKAVGKSFDEINSIIKYLVKEIK